MRNGALHPGEPFPTHPVAAPPASVAQEAKSFWTYQPLTARQVRTAKWLGVVVVLLVAIAFAGPATDGRLGLAGVVGGSMARYFPQGSTVVTLPLPPREGSFVVARAGAPDATEDVEVADVKSQLVVKQYKGGKLVSSDDGNVYSTFEYRGRVVGYIPTQRILWWRSRGYFTPAIVRSDAEQAEVDEAGERRRSARASAEKAKGNLGDRSSLLGPVETRPLEASLTVPKGAKRVTWNMASAPLYPETIVVVVSSGGVTTRQEVPPDNCRVKGGMSLAGSSDGAGLLKMIAKNQGAAVMVEVSFYSH